jgi:hypothetical protein
VVLTRGRRHSGGGMRDMGYMGGSHYYTERVAVNHVATSFQAPASVNAVSRVDGSSRR